MPQIHFYATPQDLVEIITCVETRVDLQYVLRGMFEVPRLDSTCTLVNEHLGRLTVSSSSLAPQWLVAQSADILAMCSVPQVRGGIRYVMDEKANPRTLILRPGGVYGESIIIKGDVGTKSTDPIAIAMYKQFQKCIVKHSTNVGGMRVGRQAEEMMDKGWRLTIGAKTSTEFDLRRQTSSA